MIQWQNIARSNFFIRLRSWEYWPFGILQFPLFFYWFWLSIKSRSFVFFSGSNPGIIMGGMFGESKYDVIKKIPSHLVPKTILITIPAEADAVHNQLTENKFSLPVIFKPELGERGHMVRKISSYEDIQKYLDEVKTNFLVQELVCLPLEFGVFYVRYPSQSHGRVTSVVKKKMLTVTGDGRRTLQQLILDHDRSKLQWEKLKVRYALRLNEVIAAGDMIELVSIGNHALGTTFLNGEDLINEKLSQTFDAISKQVEGFYFGRYDLRCGSIEDLYNGNVKILELNGCGAEPAHIYEPGFSILKALGILIDHWRNIYLIAKENRQQGADFISLKEAYRLFKKFKAVTS